jgi:excisionase family DNA binding protein
VKQTENYLSAVDIARQLSMHERSVRRLIESGQLPAVRFGHLVRVPESALASYIANQSEAI